MIALTPLDGFLPALAVAVCWLMLRRQLRESTLWCATVTPLASIIGSGFLVAGPLLASIAGSAALACVVVIVLLSFWMGSAIRFNILHDHEPTRMTKGTGGNRLRRTSEIALAIAYVISITFYIRLMSGFLLSGSGAYSTFNADLLASVILLLIGLHGWRRGLHALERLEEYSVTLKLAIIASLLAGLVFHGADHGYDLGGMANPDVELWDGLRQLAGLLLIVQGFETSRYLDASYDAPMRARSMRLAQWLAAVIYVAFVALSLPLMGGLVRAEISETAIIEITAEITLVLPAMLVVAAAMSQFSAAVADTIGAGGVIESETRHTFTARNSYPLIALLAVVLIWTADIFTVIAFASRAFAFYYMLQALLAARLALKAGSGGAGGLRAASYVALALLLLAVVAFARPIEA